MEDYKNRVLQEKKDLDVKINKLTAFLFSGDLLPHSVDAEERRRLDEQLHCMMNYSRVLLDRMESFRQ